MSDFTFDTYDRSFFTRHIAGEMPTADVIGKVLWSIFRPRSVVDVGCGPGLILRALKAGHDTTDPDTPLLLTGLDHARGREVWKDLVPEVQPGWFVPVDLRDWKANPDVMELVHHKRDLVICTEVAEHLPPESGPGIVELVVSLSGGTVVWSAATPGQGGEGHLNERPLEHWQGFFDDYGFRLDAESTLRVLDTIGPVSASPWYRRLRVYRKR